MGHIYLVRHGQDQDNAEGLLNGQRDRPLTDKGREQAEVVGEKLKVHDISTIYSSPLKRAYETASIIAKKLNINRVIKNEYLIERNFGILTGRPIEDIQKLTDKILVADKVNYFLEAEGSEDFPTLYERAKKLLQTIQLKHKNNVLLVTHGDIGKMIRAAYHGWTWKQGLLQPYFDNTGILELKPDLDEIE